MTPLIRPESKEPVLILTDEDYRRAFTVAASERSPRERAAPPRAPRKSAWPIAIGLLLAAASGDAVLWVGRGAFRPVPVVVARAPKRIPRLAEASTIVEPPVPARRVAIPPPADEPGAPPDPAPPAVVPAEQKPWNGGRVWARLRLRIEHRSHVEESEHQVMLLWEGSRFVLDRTSSRPADPTTDRLELLLRLPSENESWRRLVTATAAETLRMRAGDLACRRVEGEDRFPQGLRRFRYWYSDEFPAGAVQAEQTLGEFTLVSRVLDFGAAPADGKEGR